jgi:hypothetical protein
MKKILTVAVCFFVLLVSCKKDDTTPPKLTMKGASTMTISLNSPFTDPGVTANDNEDGSTSVTSDASATNPDINLTGHYIITYTSTDAAGNTNKITRNVIVVNDAAFMAGGYDAVYSCGLNYVDGIIASTNTNNRIIFNEIGRYPNANVKLMADIDFSTSTIIIDSTVINCGTFPNIVDRSFSGGGALASNNTVIQLNVTEKVLPSGPSTNCAYTYTRQ